MPEYDDMLRSLPSAYRRDPWVTGLLGAVAGVDSAQRADAAETADQMFLDSMTWLLPVEEREAGLTPEKGASIEDRRAALAAKWRSLSGKCDIELIRTICGSWNGIAAEVTYDGVSCVTILFRSTAGMPGNMESVRRALREVIPAHLRYEIIAALLRQGESRTYSAATGTRAKHYGEHEVML